jgi:glutathione peroxidase
MAIYDTDIAALDGTPDVLADLDGKVTLVVNVASKCGLTPQYEQLEAIHEQYSDRGFSVLGVPCNQFLEQEPGSADEIATFCSTTYGVTFPMTEKIEVNGAGRHPIYDQLTRTPTSRVAPATSSGTSRSSWWTATAP